MGAETGEVYTWECNTALRFSQDATEVTVLEV